MSQPFVHPADTSHLRSFGQGPAGLRVAVVLVAMVLVVLTGCGGGDSADPPAESTSTDPAAAIPAEPATPCEFYEVTDYDLFLASQAAGEPEEQQAEILENLDGHAEGFKTAVPELTEAIDARVAHAEKILGDGTTEADAATDGDAYTAIVAWAEKNC